MGNEVMPLPNLGIGSLGVSELLGLHVRRGAFRGPVDKVGK